jgi:U3 small nucleolar RNA-associated protein 6
MNLELLRKKRKDHYESFKPSASEYVLLQHHKASQKTGTTAHDTPTAAHSSMVEGCIACDNIIQHHAALTSVLLYRYSSNRRICFIFERALRRFGDNVSLWLQYIEFCRRSGSSKMLGKTFPKAVQAHPLVAPIWLRAAQWEFTDNNNIEAARVFLQRGLRMIPKSQDLWLYMFKMEVQYIARLRERKRLLGLMALRKVLTLPTPSPSLSPPLPPPLATSPSLSSSPSPSPSLLPKDAEIENGEAAEEEEGIINIAEKVVDVMDDKDRIFLSGIMPKTIYKNAIAGIPADYRFRLLFAELLPEVSKNAVTKPL